MPAGWDYAQLTKKAAESGGPEALMAAVKAGAHAEGRAQGTRLGFALAAAAVGAIGLGRRGYVAWDARRSERAAAAAEAERELVRRLNHEAVEDPTNDVRDAHPDEDPSDDSPEQG